MRARLVLSAVAACLFAACSQVQTSHITGMVDLPLKTTALPNDRWQEAPLRANAQYVLYGANSNKERRLRIGDYYFLSWYDAEPQKPVRVEMLYTQALTGADVLSRVVEYNEPRESCGTRKEKFHFSGPERAKRGDVMTWKVNLYCDGKLVDSLQSYLWE
ncbi:MAG: hypothetical protein IKY91_08790 [Akkermansia sp.]|nr:hypothetical protein [Akkermansia sp.]